jgi:hypothetical protein
MRPSGVSRSAVLGTVIALTGGVMLSSGCGADDSNRRVHRDHDGGPDDNADTGGVRSSTGGKSGTGGTSSDGGDASADGGATSGGTSGTGGATADGNTNPPNGIYEYSAGDTTATQLLVINGVNSFIVDSTSIYYRAGYADATILKAPVTGLVGSQGKPIVTRAAFGAFAGHDDKYIYTSYPWGNGAGPALKIVK